MIDPLSAIQLAGKIAAKNVITNGLKTGELHYIPPQVADALWLNGDGKVNGEDLTYIATNAIDTVSKMPETIATCGEMLGAFAETIGDGFIGLFS